MLMMEKDGAPLAKRSARQQLRHERRGMCRARAGGGEQPRYLHAADPRHLIRPALPSLANP
jgi:hypothetical protein